MSRKNHPVKICLLHEVFDYHWINSEGLLDCSDLEVIAHSVWGE